MINFLDKFLVGNCVDVLKNIEEKALIEFIKQHYATIKTKCDYFHLIRNEKMVKIYNEKGQGTEPDFILLSKLKNT